MTWVTLFSVRNEICFSGHWIQFSQEATAIDCNLEQIAAFELYKGFFGAVTIRWLWSLCSQWDIKFVFQVIGSNFTKKLQLLTAILNNLKLFICKRLYLLCCNRWHVGTQWEMRFVFQVIESNDGVQSAELSNVAETNRWRWVLVRAKTQFA